MSLKVDPQAQATSHYDQWMPGFIQELLGKPIPHANQYSELSCTEAQKEAIEKLITLMGEQNYFQLLWNSKELIGIGRNISNVHPLRFLSVILSNPELIRNAQSIQGSQKWRIFMHSVQNNCEILHQQGQVDRFIEDFAKELNIDPRPLLEFTERNAWEEMVQHLLRAKSP